MRMRWLLCVVLGTLAGGKPRLAPAVSAGGPWPGATRSENAGASRLLGLGITDRAGSHDQRSLSSARRHNRGEDGSCKVCGRKADQRGEILGGLQNGNHQSLI